MAKKTIFRRIGGKIIPIRVSKGFSPDPLVQKSSAKMRDSLKAKAAARTSLREKRIQAVNSVRRFVSDRFNPFNAPSKSIFDDSHGPKIPGRNWPRLGMGSSVKAVADPLRSGWLVKSGNSWEIAKRGEMKAILSKHNLAPETFHVQTKSRDYLVQKIIKDVATPHIGEPAAKFTAAAKARDRLVEAIRKQDIEPFDIGDFLNVGKQKGRTKALDSGMFEMKRNISHRDRKRIEKFLISSRRRKK